MLTLDGILQTLPHGKQRLAEEKKTWGKAKMRSIISLCVLPNWLLSPLSLTGFLSTKS